MGLPEVTLGATQVGTKIGELVGQHGPLRQIDPEGSHAMNQLRVTRHIALTRDGLQGNLAVGEDGSVRTPRVGAP